MADTIKEVLENLSEDWLRIGGDDILTSEAMSVEQALAEIKRIISSSKPSEGKHHYMGDKEAKIHDDALKQYSTNLMKALGEEQLIIIYK